MAIEEIRLQFIADMDQLKQQMLAGGASAEEAEKRIGKLTRAYGSAERAAKKLAKQQEEAAKEEEKAARAAEKLAKEQERVAAAQAKAADKTGAAMKAIESLGRLAGGPVGELTGALGDLGDMSEGAVGVLGSVGTIAAGTVGAFAAGAAAVYGYIEVMTSLGDAVVEAITDLDKFSTAGSAAVPQGARDAAADYTLQMLRMSASMQKLTMLAAELFLPTFNGMLDVINNGIEAFNEFTNTLGMGRARLAAIVEILTVTASGNLAVWASTGKLKDAFTQLITAETGVEHATGKMGSSFGDVYKSMVKADDFDKKFEANLKALEAKQKDNAKAATEHAKALEQLHEITVSANESTMTAEQKIISKYDERLRKIDELDEKLKGSTEAEAARIAALREMTTALAEEQDKADKARVAAEEKTRADKAAADQKAHEQQLKYLQDEQAAFKAVNDMRQEAILKMAETADQIYGGIADLAVWAIDKQIESMGKLSDSEKKEAKRLWALRQSAAISSAIMSGAVAYMNALAAFAPTGFLAPALAAAVVGPPLAMQVAQIASESPPSFAIGGVVEADHRTIQAAPGEGVVTRRGMAALGPDGLAALNRGRMAGGGGEQLVMRYRHRDLSIVLRDHLRLDTPLARALDGATVPGRRTR